MLLEFQQSLQYLDGMVLGCNGLILGFRNLVYERKDLHVNGRNTFAKPNHWELLGGSDALFVVVGSN